MENLLVLLSRAVENVGESAHKSKPNLVLLSRAVENVGESAHKSKPKPILLSRAVEKVLISRLSRSDVKRNDCQIETSKELSK